MLSLELFVAQIYNLYLNNTVAGAAKGSLIIGRKRLIDSQFDAEIQKKDGFILHKPIE